MNQDSQVKEDFYENSKHWGYQGEVYFHCPYLCLKAILTNAARACTALPSLPNYQNATAIKLPLLW